VQTDKDIIINKINKIPSIGSSVTEIQRVIPHFLDGKCNCSSGANNLGYGLTISQHTIYGGYGSCDVEVLHFNDHVIKLKLTINNSNEIIKNYLSDIIQLPFVCMDGRVSYVKTYAVNLNKYLKDSGQLYLESVDTNYRRRAAINYFSDVMSSETFKVPYRITFGLGPETFNNLRYFIVNKDYNALESILFSPSPTSRLFAARTLLYMQDKLGYRPEKKVDNRIKETIAKAQLISSGIISCWLNKFDFDYYNIVKDFEYFLATQ
jgi:hypothetical protein